ncbi:MAG TPA: hypothetical protein VF221_04735, partial [Chloroflexota bacterium]
RVISAFIAAGVLAWVGWWAFKHVLWWTPAGQDIAYVVRGAAGVNETVLTLPQSYRRAPITSTEMSRLSRMAQTKLADYYTGSPLKFWRETAKRTLSVKNAGLWTIQWRVDWVHLGELTLLPGSATATASAEVRSDRGTINRMDYRFRLVDTRAGWRVDQEDFNFQPGYGP